MLAKTANKIKRGASSLKNSTLNKLGAVKRKAVRHRWKIFTVLLSLTLIAMTVALVMEAYQGCDISNQGVIINHTQNRIKPKTYSNTVQVIGLNSELYLVPKRKFILYFGDLKDIDSSFQHKAIVARVQQGTKVMISARISCQIIASDLKQFLEEYGLNWSTYILGKTKNVITQIVSKYKFYDLNNTLIASEFQEQFASYAAISGYPFAATLLSMKVTYPEGSFSANNTQGINLLKAKNTYSQLLTNNETLTKKLAKISDLQTIAAKVGNLQAEVLIAKLKAAQKIKDMYTGINMLSASIGQANNTQLRRYLWLYFQNTYNSTYVAMKGMSQMQ